MREERTSDRKPCPEEENGNFRPEEREGGENGIANALPPEDGAPGKREKDDGRKLSGLERSAKTDTKGMIFTVLLYAVGAVSVPYAKLAAWLGGGAELEMWLGFLAKTLLSVLPFYLVVQFSMKGMFGVVGKWKSGVLLSLPAFVVAIDNFPIVPQIMGDSTINFDFSQFLPYFLYCLSIGLLEESVFRGNIFPLMLYAFPRNKKGTFFAVVASSGVFGAMHLLNLFGGFSPAVFLQVGYSFLIGCICALTMLFTGNLFFAVGVHFLFDLGGFMYDRFGSGTLWTTENILFTAVVSVICAVLLVLFFFKRDYAEVYRKWNIEKKYPSEVKK